MKKPFYTILTFLFAVSCGGNDDQIIENPKPVEKDVYQFQYKNYTVQNITVYKGPSGQKIDVPEPYLNSYWSTYQEPTWKKISLDLKKNSLHFISGTSADIKYTINIEKDSVFVNENSGKNFVGIFNKNEASFTLKRSFRYVKKMPRENVNALSIFQKTVFGMTTYQDIFGKISFDNPSSMDAIGDDILWANMDYYYNSL
ncbi:hypothetical protein KB553_23530 (plasmid) [Chryseobacterium rhizoplanae]|uniref:hypothetical protein n=1 Tax=Chryseobacterium rhizoplanae TaxID=1609531 RepID=UPI001CE2BA8E|nr:hypothetical protein [Chryseobacterium rhizoplanae]UCA62255.1 hypothetical protein KB553_23530 [Chryseobacterium rhizoplanae]